MANDMFAWTLMATLGILAAVLTVAVFSWLIGDDDDPPQESPDEVDFV